MACFQSVAARILASLFVMAGDRPPPTADNVVLQNCPVDYKLSTMVAAPQVGLVHEILVQPGEYVKANQPLGRLRDQDMRSIVEMRAAELESDIEVQASEAAYKQAAFKYNASAKLARDRYMSAEDFELAKLEMTLKGMAVEEAKKKRRIAEISLRQAQSALDERVIRSPHNGFVAEAFKRAGEVVLASDKAVFRIDNLDVLRVTGQVDVVDLWRVKAGQPVRVSVEIGGADLPVESEFFTGHVVSVDTAVSPKTQTCQVVAEINNRDRLLRAGLVARMEIEVKGLDAEKTAAAPRSPTASGPKPGAPPPNE